MKTYTSDGDERTPPPRITFLSLLLIVLAGFSLASVAEAGSLCTPLPSPQGIIIDVDASQTTDLPGIVASAPVGSTIRLAPGTYNLNGSQLMFRRANVTLRSSTGNRDDVILDGNLHNGRYVSSEIISIFASNITIADLTIQRAYSHPIHITPPPGTNITGALLHNLHVLDPGEQAIKINATDATNHVDNGVIRCSVIELTDAGRPLVRKDFLPCYTGGIDAHRSRNWRVSDNTIQGFWCAAGLSEHGIHFWNDSRDTIVERNHILNNARGIGFGLGGSGHSNGIIRNNFVMANDPRLFASGARFDAGIGLENAANAKVLHNTVVSTTAPYSSIEWRWSPTAMIMNNLVSHNLRAREGGGGTLAGNLPNAPLSLFVNVALADLHLVPAASQAIDHAVAVPPGDADDDIDGESRFVTARDMGADEEGNGNATPTITSQPANMTVTVPATATFSVTASGTAPLSYQWQKNGAPIAGATSASYTTPATTTADSGSSYRVVASNAVSNVTSSTATLTVNAGAVAPSITTQPANITVTTPATATFSVTASGTAPLSYQWQKNGATIAGATSASYTTPATTTADSGSSYRVVVSNTVSSVTSSAATLTVNAGAVAPAITSQPANMTVTAPANATFSVSTSGTAPLSYQWQKNGANIAGATSASYTTPATTRADSGSSYRVVVSNTVSSVTSSAATLKVRPVMRPVKSQP